MPIENITVKTSYNNADKLDAEGRPTKQFKIGHFNYFIPKTCEEALTHLVDEKGVSREAAQALIDETFAAKYMILIQDPARKELDRLDADMPEHEVDEHLQKYMDSFVLGQRRPRRTASETDTVENFVNLFPRMPRWKQRETLQRFGLDPDLAEGLPSSESPGDSSESEELEEEYTVGRRRR